MESVERDEGIATIAKSCLKVGNTVFKYPALRLTLSLMLATPTAAVLPPRRGNGTMNSDIPILEILFVVARYSSLFALAPPILQGFRQCYRSHQLAFDCGEKVEADQSERTELSTQIRRYCSTLCSAYIPFVLFGHLLELAALDRLSCCVNVVSNRGDIRLAHPSPGFVSNFRVTRDQCDRRDNIFKVLPYLHRLTSFGRLGTCEPEEKT